MREWLQGCKMAKPGSTLKKLKEEEREVRKNLIIDAAIRLFGRKPFNQVGMREIAAEAGMSPASIYRYFSDRDELFVEALLRESTAIELRFIQIVEQGVNSTIEEIANNFVGYLLEHGSFFQMMTHFMIDGGMSEGSIERFNVAERHLLNLFDEVFRKIGAAGSVRLLSHAFFAALNGIVITFRNYPGRTSEETEKHVRRLAALIAAVFKKGVT
jgi:AcrR family transcriptional regulator